MNPRRDPIEDPARWGVPELLAALRAGKTTSVAVVEEMLAQCEKHARLGAFYHLDSEAALGAAEQADAARAAGDERSLLGLPLAIKDNIHTAEMPTTAGTPLLRDFFPKYNAPVLQRLLDAGAFVLGKTSMHELAFGIAGNHPQWGPARNPHDLNRIPGGSSAGTAIAVATGMVPAGLGSDTGGSVRIPAALCGVVGLRPTTGRYPNSGVIPISNTRDTVGPLARTVSGLAVLDSVITGSDKGSSEFRLADLRLGVPDGFFFDDADPELIDLFEGALDRLRCSGITVLPVDVGDVGALYHASGFPITLYETEVTLQAYLKENGLPYSFLEVANSAASPDVRKILRSLCEGGVSLEDYETAMTVHRPALQSLLSEIFMEARVVGIVYPTTPIPAVPIGQDEIELNGRPVSTFELFIRNSGPGSVAGLPGLALPCGKTTGGLPVGLSIDGPAFSDRFLLRVGIAIEETVAAEAEAE